MFRRTPHDTTRNLAWLRPGWAISPENSPDASHIWARVDRVRGDFGPRSLDHVLVCVLLRACNCGLHPHSSGHSTRASPTLDHTHIYTHTHHSRDLYGKDSTLSETRTRHNYCEWVRPRRTERHQRTHRRAMPQQDAGENPRNLHSATRRSLFWGWRGARASLGVRPQTRPKSAR